MDACRRATRNVSPALNRELARYGGLNPFGRPVWRVVLAEDVLEQSFGTMRHMPCVNVDDEIDIRQIEPEAFSSGEMWLPKYDEMGFGLERWFPAGVWGSQWEWAQETSQDGTTRMKGEFPRQGDYFMVGDGWYRDLRPADFWKREIDSWMAMMAAQDVSPAAALSRNLYKARLREELKREAFAEEVDRIHRHIVQPALATVGTTAQRMRDQVGDEMGWSGHLPAG